MKSSQVIILLALVIGFLAGAIFKGDSENRDPDNDQAEKQTVTQYRSNSASDMVDISNLEQLLQDETRARKSLEEKLEALNQKVAALDQNIQLASVESTQEIDTGEQIDAENSRQNWFNEQALIDSGMNSSLATELKTFFEQQELDRMYLRDQSIREGWDRQKFRDEIQTIMEAGDAFLSQLDDSDYDAYLYASKQPNRVKVTSVLDSSQAGTAGIQPGDHIIRYNNERIYSGFELRKATSGGDISDSVAVEVERDGEVLEFYLSRGPIGIRMNSVSVKP